METTHSAPESSGSALQTEGIVQALEEILRQDQRVKAMWLKGSLARPGDEDRHSDIDLCIWLEPEDAPGFRQELESRLAAVRPVLHYHELFGGSMIVSLLQGEEDQIFSLDVFIETADELRLTERKTRVLWDRDGKLSQQPIAPPDAESLRRNLDVEIRYFWGLFANLPSIERDELIPAVRRLGHEVEQIVKVCSLGRGRPRDVGENRANELLEPEERRELEGALALPELSCDSLVKAHLKLARVMQRRGRIAAARLDASYPEDLERAVLVHVRQELTRMGLVVDAEVEPALFGV